MMIAYEDDKSNKNPNNKEKFNFEDRINEVKIDSVKAKKQVKLMIKGIEVYFPYPPYPNQLSYMEKGKI